MKIYINSNTSFINKIEEYTVQEYIIDDTSYFKLTDQRGIFFYLSKWDYDKLKKVDVGKPKIKPKTIDYKDYKVNPD